MSKPGWVDLQVNGHIGVDYSSPDLTADDFARSAEALYKAGTEIFLPTIITSAPELYRHNVPVIRQAVERFGLQKQVPGVHLEGPLITSKGAHNPDLLLECSAENVRKLWDWSEGFVKLLTLSADSPGAPEAIREAASLGITVSAGHHMAGYADVRRAADAGCRLLTHLGNACPNLTGRHENPLLAGLAEDRMTAMIITDGHHLPAELVKLIIKVKGPSHIIVTSDACSLTGYPPGRYHVLGNDAVLEECGRLYNPEKQCLVAAVATMDMCMKFLRSLDVLTEEELLAVGRTNALKMIGLA